MKDRSAYNKVIKARTQLLISNPFFGCLAMHLKVVEQADKKWWPMENTTMAVDGRCLYYFPKFVHELGERELIGVVAHECMHVAWMHMTRRGTRNPMVWNMAGDHVINLDLLKAGFTLPKCRLADDKFANMSTEEVYSRLYQELPKIKLKLKIAGDGEGDGQPIDIGGCGAVLDASKPGDQAGADQVAHEWEGIVRTAIAVAKTANAGRTPGYLERLVKELSRPKITWRDKTRDWIDQNMTTDFSWARPNRRWLSQRIILPGVVPDALHHLVFLGDVSGSISKELHRAYLSEVAGALDEGIADKMSVVYFDTSVRHVDEFMRGDIVTSKVIAGGGTDYRPAFDWVRENAPDASGVICLTDMFPSTWEIVPLDCPVLWGAYATEKTLEDVTKRLPFGHIIHIDGWI